MYKLERKITREIYNNAKNNRGYLTSEDEKKVFDISELCGYGIYGTQAFERNGEYFVSYYRGSTCD